MDRCGCSFDGINYRANIWLNGKLIADTNRVTGADRTYTFNVTSAIHFGQPKCWRSKSSRPR